MYQPGSLQKESGSVERLVGEFGNGILYAGIAIGTLALFAAEWLALQDPLEGKITDTLASE